MDNRKALDDQLRETYGETVDDLKDASQNTRTSRIVVRKMEIPPLVIQKTIKRIVADENQPGAFTSLEKPTVVPEKVVIRTVLTPKAENADQGMLVPMSVPMEVGESPTEVVGDDLYQTAAKLAAIYRLDSFTILSALKPLYTEDGIVPENHLPELCQQIEAQTQKYRVEEEQVEVALALIKPDGFETETDENGEKIYTTQITYQKNREHLLLKLSDLSPDEVQEFGFHYDPYNFDSQPEQNFFTQMLRFINLEPDQVDDIYFTGGLSDPNKTDFFLEYKGKDGKWHHYHPDFLVRRKDGRCYIVEIKAEQEHDDTIDGVNGRKAMAVRGWERLNPDKLKYEMIFTASDTVGLNQLSKAVEFIKERT
jgi:hypothetical protein